MLESKLFTAKGRKLICQMSGYIIRKNGRVYTVHCTVYIYICTVDTQYLSFWKWRSHAIVWIFFLSCIEPRRATDWQAKIVLCGIKKNAGKTPRWPTLRWVRPQKPILHTSQFFLIPSMNIWLPCVLSTGLVRYVGTPLMPSRIIRPALISGYWVSVTCRHPADNRIYQTTPNAQAHLLLLVLRIRNGLPTET